MSRDFHPCQFNFQNTDVRPVGSPLSGGVALNGYEDRGEGSGGGFWRADFSEAQFGGIADDRRAATLAWRATQAGALSGSTPEIVHFCDGLHQPIIGGGDVPHSDETPFDDSSLYSTPGAGGTILAVVNGQAGGLNATILDMAITSGRPLLSGERFTLVHETWGPRAYETSSIETVDGGYRLTFIPPVRGGVAVGDAVDFDDIRCRMRRISDPTNALSIGRYGSGSVSFQEDMRPPT